ncbi:MAG: lipoate--protein ligase family protein [Candidatus Binatota bacterium]
MKVLDLTLPTPQHNLACEEALIQWCEEDGYEDEILRFWEPREHFAVLGYSGKVNSELNLISCQDLCVPVLRRCSGGGTVLQGPGCLNYALILRIPDREALKGITETNAFIMQRLKNALEPILGPGIEIQGFSDLALGTLKFSGNAQYRKRRFLLFHGTFLLRFDISLVEKLLPIPLRQPPYRQNRSHGDFLANLNLPSDTIKQTLKRAWHATEELKDLPLDRIERLARDRYADNKWTFKF